MDAHDLATEVVLKDADLRTLVVGVDLAGAGVGEDAVENLGVCHRYRVRPCTLPVKPQNYVLTNLATPLTD